MDRSVRRQLTTSQTNAPQTASPTAASSSYTSPFSTETESARSTLDKLLSTHVSNHYTSGVAAVYVLPDPAFPPESEPEPEPEVAAPAVVDDVADAALATDVEGSEATVAETAAETAQVVTEVLDQETVETARAEAEEANSEGAPAAAADASVDEGGDGSMTATGENTEMTQTGTDAPQKTEAETTEGQDADDDKMDVASPAAPVSSPATDGTTPAAKEEEQNVGVGEKLAAPAKQPRPSNQFGLYFVGHKYSPNNYWCVHPCPAERWQSPDPSLDAFFPGLDGGARRIRLIRPLACSRGLHRSTSTTTSKVRFPEKKGLLNSNPRVCVLSLTTLARTNQKKKNQATSNSRPPSSRRPTSARLPPRKPSSPRSSRPSRRSSASWARRIASWRTLRSAV